MFCLKWRDFCFTQQRSKQIATDVERTLVLVVTILLLCSIPVSARGGYDAWGRRARQLQQGSPLAMSPAPSNATAVITASPPPLVNSTTTGNNVTVDGALITNATAPPAPTPVKETLKDKWKKVEEGKTPAERGIAITVGVLMLVSILTCLVCCVFRRGGQWRIPGLQWIKKKFGPKDRYSRYADNQDDGF